MIIRNDKGQITAFTQGSTFGPQDRCYELRMKTYSFSCDDSEYGAKVHATDPENALRALGIGSPGEREHGDFSELIKCYENGELHCLEYETTCRNIQLSKPIHT